MKTKLIIIVFSMLASVGCTGCGKGPGAQQGQGTIDGPCKDVANGSWQNIYKAGYRLTLNAACQGASNEYCAESFTYHPQPDGTVVLLTTATNSGPECLPLGSTTCAKAGMLDGMLHVECGGGRAITANYQRL